jgi:membrane associated rhomboid family serine protease
MRTHRTVPFATLTLALFTTVIEIFRLTGGHYFDVVLANLDVVTWPEFYNQPWRVVTSPFTHRDIIAYFVNLAFLLLFGWEIERKHGWAIFLGVFFGALVSAYVIWTNLAHDWIWGISGGVCGLFGFSLIANRCTPWWTTVTHRPLHALYLANLVWAVIIDVTNLIPYRVAHLDHLMGILYGMAFGRAFLLAPQDARWRGAVIALPIVLFASLFYSPWQVEWRLVKTPPKLVTANADCRLQSPIQDVYIPAPITFVNASTKPIAVYWLDYEGNPQFMLWLGPSDSAKDNAFVGHPFCIVDGDTEEALQVVIMTEPGQTIIIH